MERHISGSYMAVVVLSALTISFMAACHQRETNGMVYSHSNIGNKEEVLAALKQGARLYAESGLDVPYIASISMTTFELEIPEVLLPVVTNRGNLSLVREVAFSESASLQEQAVANLCLAIMGDGLSVRERKADVPVGFIAVLVASQ
jgi:hypothetical protein